MTKLQALRAVLASRRDHADMARIGRRVIWDRSDGREKLTRFTKWQVKANRILRRMA